MDKKLLKGTQTRENLMKAFAGESMARNRYSMFSSIAKKEGLIEISDTFILTAKNELEHAEVFYKFLDGEEVLIQNTSYPSCYGDTKANLLCAAKYEEEEHSLLYPEFGRLAKEEGFIKISETFYNIATIEERHSKRYAKLYERLKNNMMFRRDEPVKWICSHCGFVIEDKMPPEKCPVCEHPQGYYEVLCKCE